MDQRFSHAASRTPGGLFLALAALCLSVALGACSSGSSRQDGDDAGPVDQVDAGGDGQDAGPAGDLDAGSDGGSGSDAGTKVALKIRQVTPPRGGLSGGTVVVLGGAGFVDGFAESGGADATQKTQISFGGNAAVDVNVIDDDTIEVKSPPGARGDVDIVLTNPNGSYTCSKCFTYFEPVELYRITPATGSTLGGEPVTLVGKGFVDGVLVLVGGSQATGVQVAADGLSLTAKTPPGQVGSADVGVVGANSASFLRRSFVYLQPMRITSVSPVAAPVAGGVEVTLSGTGFTSDATVQVGGAQATGVTLVSDTQLKATVPAASAAGAVDVQVTARRGSALLPKGFAYWDDARELHVYGVSPRQGPVSGGTCAQGAGTCLHISGSGFSADALSVKIGQGDAAVRVIDDHTLEADLPAGQPGVVDVQARTVRGGAVLPQAFAYVRPLTVVGVDPAQAPAAGTTPATTAVLKGTGFDAGCHAFIGANEAPVQAADPAGTSLTVTVPTGSPGARDVRVTCGDPASLGYQEATLVNGFQFTSPLRLLQVDPDNGAIAGNTAVNLYGSGFASGMQVFFGRLKAPTVDVKSPHLAVVRTPRADPGIVDVAVHVGQDQDVLRGGYGYLDPTNILGGASGGPMRGILNVTVLNNTQGMSGPVDGVTVSVNNDQLVGVTDDRGQVTFSDASLLKPVTITGAKAKFATATIATVDARNVTLFMEMNEGDGDPSQPPPPPPPAVFSGRVCGFKTPPGFSPGLGQTLVAHVYLSAQYVYAAPPFRQMPTPATVIPPQGQECAPYSISTRRYGPLAIYAEFGIQDDSGATFTPLLMGIKRGLEASPDKKVTGLDIVLDMHRDVSVPVKIDGAEPPAGGMVINQVFSYLDLGGEGVIPLAQTQSTSNEFVFNNHPRIGGEGLVFLNWAAVADLRTGAAGPPYSFFFRRQYGDLAAGVEIGPMLAFTKLTSPAPGAYFAGSLGWGFTNGVHPDVQQIFVEQPQGFSSKPIWNVVLPGSEVGVSLPASALSRIPSGTGLTWTVLTAKSPRFDYDRFGFQQLGVNAWTAFTQDQSVFLTP